METIKIASYQDLQTEIYQLITSDKTRREASERHYSPLLFRGQSHATWELKTTLERFHPEVMTQNEYSSLMKQLKILTETALDISLPEDAEYDRSSAHGPPAYYPLLVYARHHGFPSPLLDWTESWYIALFFALAYAPDQGNGSSAVFAYREYCGSGKSNERSEPHIVGLGPAIRTHRRHLLQQAWYTMCQFENPEGQLVYANHEDTFKRNSRDQDALWKFEIPWSEKNIIIQELYKMNITAFTLFGTIDRLMDTLALRLLRP